MFKYYFHVILLACFISPNLVSATELIPINAYRASGDFEEINSGTTLDVDDNTAYGFVLNFDAESNTQYEVLYSYQSSRLRSGTTFPSNILFDIDITYLHGGGIKLFPINDTTSSYVGAGLGVTQFNPDFSGYSTETKFSLSLSGGIKKMFTKSLGLRAGLNWYATPVNSGSSIFCGSESGCTVRFRGDVFSQFDASIGLVLKF